MVIIKKDNFDIIDLDEILDYMLMEGDCLERMKLLPDNSVDLIASDIPYGMKFMQMAWDLNIPSVEVFKECLRVLKDGHCMMIMSSDKPLLLSSIINNIKQAGFEYYENKLMFWTYHTGMPKGANLANSWDNKLLTEWMKKNGHYKIYQDYQKRIKKMSKDAKEGKEKRQTLIELIKEFDLWKREEKKQWAKEEYNVNLVYTFEEHWGRKNRSYITDGKPFDIDRNKIYNDKTKKTLPDSAEIIVMDQDDYIKELKNGIIKSKEKLIPELKKTFPKIRKNSNLMKFFNYNDEEEELYLKKTKDIRNLVLFTDLCVYFSLETELKEALELKDLGELDESDLYSKNDEEEEEIEKEKIDKIKLRMVNLKKIIIPRIKNMFSNFRKEDDFIEFIFDGLDVNDPIDVARRKMLNPNKRMDKIKENQELLQEFCEYCDLHDEINDDEEIETIEIGYSQHHSEGRENRASKFDEMMQDEDFGSGDGKIDWKVVSPEAKKVMGKYAGCNPKPVVEPIIIAMKPLSHTIYRCINLECTAKEKYQKYHYLKLDEIETIINEKDKDEIICKYCNSKVKKEKSNFMKQTLLNSGGSTNFNACKFPLAENDVDIDRELSLGNSGFAGDYKDGWDQTGANKASGKTVNGKQGRFPANLIVSDDVLGKDGVITKSAGGMTKGTGMKGFYEKNDLEGGFSNNKNHVQAGIGGYKDIGSNSKFYDLNRWFEKKIEQIPLKTYPFLQVPKPSKFEKNLGLGDLKSENVNDGREMPIDNPFQRGETLRQNKHPTVKSIQLGCYLIELGSEKNDLILDMYCGSGTFLISGLILGRKAIGIDITEKYLSISYYRLEYWKELIREYKEKKLNFSNVFGYKKKKLSVKKLLKFAKKKEDHKKSFRKRNKNQKIVDPEDYINLSKFYKGV